MHELRELRELRRTVLISGSGLEGHTVSLPEGRTDSALEGHTVSLPEGSTGSVACQSVVPKLHVELLSCPCCMVDDEDRVFCLNALRSSGPQMRGVPRPGASENLESNLPDVENVPSDDEPSDIPAWGDLFPDEDEDLLDVSPKRPRRSAPSPLAPPDDPDPPPQGREVVEEPRIPLNSVAVRVHQAHGHAPFDSNCASCVSSRGKVPARRLRRKLQKEDQTIGIDFMYFGKLRVLLVVHLSSHYVLGLPAVDLRDKTLEHNFDRFVREIGLTGKTVTVRCDNEVSLLAAVERLTTRSIVARAVIDPVAGYRPQSKGGVERMVAVVKQSFWSVWLDLELEVNRSQSVEAETHLPLGGLLWQAALLYTCRCHNLWHTGLNDVTTPIDRVHEQIVQRTRTLAFGSVVFAKTSKSKAHLAKFRGKNLAKCTYLGPVHPRGGGVFACLEGSCEVEVFPARRPLADAHPTYDGGTLKQLAEFNLLAPDDEARPRILEPLDPNEEPPLIVEEELVPDAVDGPPVAGEMDVDLPGSVPEDVPDLEDMELTDSLIGHMVDDSLLMLLRGPDLLLGAKAKSDEGVDFVLPFGGTKIRCSVPSGAISETSGEVLETDLLKKSMRLELEELESFKVGESVSEKVARDEARKSNRRVLSCRWVNTVKKPGLYRSRLVVRDFASMGGTTLAEGIYSPTTTLEGLRLLLSVLRQRGSMMSCDVSVAFMHAAIARPEFVQLPPNITTLKGERVFLKLFRAMNGLRSAPLSWYRELSSFLSGQGFAQILDPTIFRRKGKHGLIVALFYVDDLLIWAEDNRDALSTYEDLRNRYKLKLTGELKEGMPGEVSFLGRKIFRRHHGSNHLYFGLDPGYLRSCWDEFSIQKPVSKLPPLERRMSEFLKRGKEMDEPLSPSAHERYRRVLGRLAWASLSRPDLQFITGFLGRYQAAPHGAAEAAMRDVLRWVASLPHLVQKFPGERSILCNDMDDESLTCFVDASWSLNSTSGGVLTWNNCCLKTFSRKQSTIALSSAEAELAALTEVAKEGLYVSLLVQTLFEGIPEDTETGRYLLRAYSDSESALSIAQMNTLLRKVRHIELRAAFLQQLVAKERLTLEHIPGKINPADARTKSPTPENLVSLYEACGLVEEPMALDHMKSCGSDRKKVSFKLETEPNNEHLNVEASTLEVPEEWNEPGRCLSEGHVRLVVLELCCEPGSALSAVCSGKRKVAYFGVTKRIDLLKRNTFRLIQEILKVFESDTDVGVFVHVSTLCTAGCGFRRINFRRQGFLKHWRELIRVHKVSWRRIRSLFSAYRGHPRLLLTHEWPARSDLWKESVCQNTAKVLGLERGCSVDRCQFDGAFKRWWFASNSSQVVWELSGYRCDKQHEHHYLPTKESGVYPRALGKALVEIAAKVLKTRGA